MSEIKNPSIKMVVKRTQYQTVTIDEYAGYTMPKTLTKFFEMCEGIKNYPSGEVIDGNWEDGDTVVESFEITIGSDKK